MKVNGNGNRIVDVFARDTIYNVQVVACDAVSGIGASGERNIRLRLL